MAKKNSSKTATEKAIQASEPRVMVYKDWKGISIADAPLTWHPLETGRYKHRESDLPQNYFMIQNNLETSDTLGVETRKDSVIIGQAPSGWKFTGVSMVFHKWIFVVAKNISGEYENIFYRNLTQTPVNSIWSSGDVGGRWVRIQTKYFKANKTGSTITSYTAQDNSSDWHIKEIGAYEDNLVVTATTALLDGAVFLAHLNYNNLNDDINVRGDNWASYNSGAVSQLANFVISNPEAPDPTSTPTLSVSGMAYGNSPYEGEINPDTGEWEDAKHPHTVRIEVCYAYTSRFGSTRADMMTPALIYTEFNPALWSSARYVTISKQQDSNIKYGSGINGIDFYGRDTENTNWVFIGHINVTPGQNNTSWSYTWLGNMTDISQWTNSQLNIPSDNDTLGPNVGHFSVHDSKMYYWGDPYHPYRIYIGGVPGSEFSTARGLGGAYVDIEPGSGYEVMGTAKWKTTSGANIVTILCGNSNTNKVKRFNLVETNITITNEISYKGYMYEEVSNVVGCNSRYGYGVFNEGLYSLNRYGLMLTTMAMEYNNQMKNQVMSSPIEPIFTDRLGTRLKDARMVCINDIIYIALSEDRPVNYVPQEQVGYTEPVKLDNVILCYDTLNQCWYTFTHDEHLNQNYQQDPDSILHILAIDSDQATEGLGVITESYIYLYPTTLGQDATVPLFDVLLETGELKPKEPTQALMYIQQIELRFDYFISNPENPPTVLIEGTDYYGRSFSIEKQLNIRSRGNHGKTGELRSYAEWIRLDKYVESYRIRIKGKARFRLSHINVKFYVQPDVTGSPWGFDAHDGYLDVHNTEGQIHHYIDDYNNLRRALVS